MLKNMPELFEHHRRLVERAEFRRVCGRVAEVSGFSVTADGLPAPVGAMCRIERAGSRPLPAQIVGVAGERTVLLALEEPYGVAAGHRVTASGDRQHVSVGRGMAGTILNGLGQPIGGRTDFVVESHYPLYRAAPRALDRAPITDVMPTGIRAIDALHTVGAGQRLGIFAGTGVGKSVLLGMIARFTGADVIVVALIGERGREVGDFIRRDLGEEGLRRCVLVASTSDESPVLRVRAAFVATAVAEYFRDQGRNVLLLMDSTTRIAMAQRQIGLAAGEPPTTKGYPPSVFSLLPSLMERCGRTPEGSMTGMYTVLVEGDDLNEPISDAVRGILDGHVVLSRDLAQRGHYPAVSVLESISRLMTDLVDERAQQAAARLRRQIAIWRDAEDLINVGAYAAGTNPEVDAAVKSKPLIDAFLRQAITEQASWVETRERLGTLAMEIAKLEGP